MLEMYQEAAEDANDVATENHTGMTGAGMAYMRAMRAAEAAENAANTHVRSVFMAANAYHITAADDDLPDTSLNESTTEDNEAQDKARADTIADTMAAIADAADAATSAGRSDRAADDNTAVTNATVTAVWPVEDAGDDDATMDVVESTPGVLRINFDPDGQNGDGVRRSELVGQDDDGDPSTNDPHVNARTIDGVGDFMHGFDMSPIDPDGDPMELGTRVLAFTDREQEVAEVEAITAKTVVNAALADTEDERERIKSLTASSETSFTGTYDDDGEEDTPPLTGTFNCTSEPELCTLEYTGTADDVMVTVITGYTFTGSRATVPGVMADTNLDYLVFGLWIDEAAGENEGDDSVITFGAFANGGALHGAMNEVVGTATYSGNAVGAHSRTGDAIAFFSGDANLTADFGTADEEGTIEGTISNIRVDGGPALSQSIHLVEADLTDDAITTFNGAAVMGAQAGPGQPSHAYNGFWSGRFFNPAMNDTDTDDIEENLATAAGSVAGTFGVTRTLDMDTMDMDDDITESFVGAFGAHKDE